MTSHRTPEHRHSYAEFHNCIKDFKRPLRGENYSKLFLAIQQPGRNKQLFFESGGLLPANHRSQMQGTP